MHKIKIFDMLAFVKDLDHLGIIKNAEHLCHVEGIVEHSCYEYEG